MAFHSYNSTVSTYVYYRGRNYQCFDLTDHTTISVEIIRTSIAKALEISTLSSDDSIEIKTDDENYVILNNYYLINKNPWKSCFNDRQLLSSNKKVYLRIVSKTELESNTYPALVSTTVCTNETGTNAHITKSTLNKDQKMLTATYENAESTFLDNLIASANDTISSLRSLSNYVDLSYIEQLHYRALNSSTPLKFIHDVAPNQRLVYPGGKDLVLIQTKKKIGDKKRSAPPVLQISTEYVDYLRAGGTVKLISAVVNKVSSGDQSSSFCLAPYRGFWSPDTVSGPSRNTSFSNPFSSPIELKQLQEMRTNTGESVYTTEWVYAASLLLHLLYAVGTKYNRQPQPLVLFDELFILSGAQPVPSHYDFSPRRAIVTTNEHEILNKNECYIWCALGSDPTRDFQDFNSKCLSEMFTVESRPSSNVTKSMNNPVSRKRSNSCLLADRSENS